jgi:hypothetical protein
MEFIKIGDEIRELQSCLAVPVPGQSDWMSLKMGHKAVLLKGSQDFKVNTLLKVKGEFEDVHDTIQDETVGAMDMLDSLYSEWSGMPVFYISEFECLLQSDLLPKESLKSLTDARKDMLSLLTNVLSGDEIAAEYLMMHLISKM